MEMNLQETAKTILIALFVAVPYGALTYGALTYGAAALVFIAIARLTEVGVINASHAQRYVAMGCLIVGMISGMQSHKAMRLALSLFG